MNDREREISMYPTIPAQPGNMVRPTRRWRAWAPLPVAIAAVALTSACGPAYGGTSTASSSPMGAADGTTVAAASSGLGTILVDVRGRTIYEFAKDTGSTSTCAGECASIWPAVVAPDTLPSSLPGVPGRLGSTTRDDGSRQLTIAGHPVYTFSGDSAAGQTKGQGLRLNGGLWTAVSPDGAPVTGKASSSSSTY